MKIIAQFKTHVAGTGIFRIFVGKFSYRQKPGLIFLLAVNKNSEISVYDAVLVLNLAIDLRIKSNKKFLFNT